MQAKLVLLSIFLVLLLTTMIMANNNRDGFLDADHNRGEQRHSLREFLIEQLNRDRRGGSGGGHGDGRK